MPSSARQPVRLWQVDLQEAGDRLQGADPRQHQHRRFARDGAAENRRHGVPGADAATVADNAGQCVLPLEIVEPHRSRFRSNRAQHEAQALRLLKTVGLDGYAQQFPWQMSGGMQQRASICRALIREPDMLLLDKPFGALDAFAREKLRCILRDLQAAQQFNVVLVAHDLREAAFLADTIYVMSRRPGQVIVDIF